MKKLFKKNQIIITALSIMIAVAGYLNFSGKDIPLTDSVVKTMDQDGNILSDADIIDISDSDLANLETIENNTGEDLEISLNEEETSVIIKDTLEISENNGTEEDLNNAGDAVLTGVLASSSDYAVQAKLDREQTRAKTKEMLMEIINNETLSEDKKKDAINEMLTLTENMEKETSAEQLLEAKGYENSVVSINGDTVDVVVGYSEISDVERAQIEDIVKRKTKCELENIVITTMKDN